ncbi:hypothetical protein [Lautropia mirabilis]|uniref:hypothetical protein n=1 Tax=Lautropia mirabilis TaxID=47671 RepID=UPI00391F056C
MPHPEAGEVPLVASPIRLSKTPVEYRRAPPLVGEHTDEILADLGGMRQALRGCGSGEWCRVPAPAWACSAPDRVNGTPALTGR